MWVLIFTVHLSVSSYHVTYAFQSQSALYSCLNVKELLVWIRRDIWSLSHCNGSRTHNHLVCQLTLNHLIEVNKWLSCVVCSNLYSGFNCMFLSCGVCLSEWIHTLQLPEYQGTLCWKQVRDLRFWDLSFEFVFLFVCLLNFFNVVVRIYEVHNI